ncbi:transposase [bacterium]|nr:transposase [bacterium]
MKQTSFFIKAKLESGGSLNPKGKRKTARTLDSRRPLHLVLKSKNTISLFKNKHKLRDILKKQAKTFGIKVYSHSIQKDHWHLVIKITNRYLYRGFIRSLTGIIARQLGKGLWRLCPYSRIVSWGRDFLNVIDYLLLNECEVLEIVPHALRKRRRQIKKTKPLFVFAR